MRAIILHDKEQEQIGTVLLKGDADFGDVTNAWDEYLNELEDNDPDIYEFVSKSNFEICEVLDVEFYQPN